MTLNKNQRCFWSQLLISVIAIFSLPNIQELNVKLVNNGQADYQNQSVQALNQQEKLLFLTEKAQKEQSQLVISNENTVNLFKIEPHFSAILAIVLPLIRAGPHYLKK